MLVASIRCLSGFIPWKPVVLKLLGRIWAAVSHAGGRGKTVMQSPGSHHCAGACLYIPPAAAAPGGLGSLTPTSAATLMVMIITLSCFEKKGLWSWIWQHGEHWGSWCWVPQTPGGCYSWWWVQASPCAPAQSHHWLLPALPCPLQDRGQGSQARMLQCPSLSTTACKLSTQRGEQGFYLSSTIHPHLFKRRLRIALLHYEQTSLRQLN